MTSIDAPAVRPDEATPNVDATDFRLDFPLRIAVTGHRWFPDDDDRLREGVREALAAARGLVRAPRGRVDRLRDRRRAPSTGIRIILSSALAEGADRLLARAVLAESGLLEAVDPMPANHYVGTFSEDPRSEEEYWRLRDRARRIVQLPGDPDHAKAFASAGRILVERSDLLIAIWDRRPGGEGGTGEVVAHAIDRGHPVIVVDPTGQSPLLVDTGIGDLPPAFAELGLARGPGADRAILAAVRNQYRGLDQYNRSGPSDEKVRDATKTQANRLPQAEDILTLIPPARAWLLPHFVRADRVASRFAARNSAFIWSMYSLGAGAVGAIAAAIAFRHPGVAWVEVGLLGALILVYLLGRGSHVHPRWVVSRFLTERLRSAFFVCVAGLSPQKSSTLDEPGNLQPDDSDAGGPGQLQMEDWGDRAFWRIWIDRPEIVPTEAEAEPLRRLVADSWIAGQVRYHEGRRVHHERWERLQTFVLGALVIVGLFVAVLHTRDPGGSLKRWLEFLAPTLPAVAGAVAAVAAHRQHRRHAEAFRRVAARLQRVQDRLHDSSATPLLAQVQLAVTEAAEAIANETQAWVGVMQAQDIELEG